MVSGSALRRILTFETHWTAPSCLADELEYTADFGTRRRLRSSSSLSLNVIHGCPPLAIGPSLLPLRALGPNTLPQHVGPTRHVRTFYVYFPKSHQGFSLQAFMPMTSTATFVAPAQRQVSFSDTLIALFYLLI